MGYVKTFKEFQDGKHGNKIEEDASTSAAQAKLEANARIAEIKAKRQQAAKDGDDFGVQMADLDLKMANLDQQKADIMAQKAQLAAMKTISDKNKKGGEDRKKDKK